MQSNNTPPTSLFLDAIQNKSTARPPVWFMRQAGRYLPEYRSLRKKYSFVEMIHTPELACEVTLQPIERYGFDAAILYSDILIIPEVFGLHFDFTEGRGPHLREHTFSIDHISSKLSISPDYSNLDCVFDTIKLLKPELNAVNTPLIGFAGSPFSVACYLIEKGSSKTFSTILELVQHKPDTLHHILKQLSIATATYLSHQIRHGVQAIQLFDTWGSILSHDNYIHFSLNYMNMIINHLSDLLPNHTCPIIIYSKQTESLMPHLNTLSINGVSIDWNSSLSQIKSRFPHLFLQGNLNPHLLKDSKEDALKETKSICDEMRGIPGFVFNLGHGILPQTPLEHVETIVSYIKSLT